jgi:hypothetical protein
MNDIADKLLCFVESFSLTPRFNAVAGESATGKTVSNGFCLLAMPPTRLKPGVKENVSCKAKLLH